MPKDNSQHWSDFYAKEKELLEYVTTSCTLLDVVDGCEPEYKRLGDFKGVTVTKAPAYIRCVAVLPDGGAAFDLLYEEMVESLINARNASDQTSKRLPNRFPVRYNNVASITTRTNRAIKSFSLEPNEDVVLNKVIIYESDGAKLIEESFNNDAQILKEHGYHTALVQASVTSTHYGLAPTVTLVINSNDLFDKFDADHIQARVETGKQYRATLRQTGETRGKQVNYGFIVLDCNSAPEIHRASPQQPRANRLESTAQEIELPISTETSFFIKS